MLGPNWVYMKKVWSNTSAQTSAWVGVSGCAGVWDGRATRNKHTGVKKQNVKLCMCTGKIVQDTKNTLKPRRKLTTIPTPSKAAINSRKTTQNAVTRAKPPHQTKQTKYRKNQTLQKSTTLKKKRKKQQKFNVTQTNTKSESKIKQRQHSKEKRGYTGKTATLNETRKM